MPFRPFRCFAAQVLFRAQNERRSLKCIVGARFPERELGEHHDPETHLIPWAIEAALGGRQLSVFGTDYPTPDGTAIRDYTHVTDLAHAHLLALQYLINDGASVIVNLGTGTGHSVRQVIEAVEREAGRPVPVDFKPRRDGDAPALVANPARARDVLGWIPRYSSLLKQLWEQRGDGTTRFRDRVRIEELYS